MLEIMLEVICGIAFVISLGFNVYVLTRRSDSLESDVSRDQAEKSLAKMMSDYKEEIVIDENVEPLVVQINHESVETVEQREERLKSLVSDNSSMPFAQISNLNKFDYDEDDEIPEV